MVLHPMASLIVLGESAESVRLQAQGFGFELSKQLVLEGNQFDCVGP